MEADELAGWSSSAAKRRLMVSFNVSSSSITPNNLCRNPTLDDAQGRELELRGGNESTDVLCVCVRDFGGAMGARENIGSERTFFPSICFAANCGPLASVCCGMVSINRLRAAVRTGGMS
jgi:hypothetical protein